MLNLNDVTVDLGGRRILDGVSVSFKPASLTVLAGPNGAGKSTLVKVASGELRPTRGGVTLDGVELSRISASALAARRAVVPQATSLSFPFTVREVVQLGCSVPGFGVNDLHPSATEAIAAMDLVALAGRFYTQLSGGERQRVHFARALCQLSAARSVGNGATVLMLDEATSNLDISHQMLLLSRAKDEADAGRIVIAVLHDLNLAAAWADTIVLVAKGRIVVEGPPARVFESGLLSTVYNYPIEVNGLPPPGVPFVLPQRAEL